MEEIIKQNKQTIPAVFFGTSTSLCATGFVCCVSNMVFARTLLLLSCARNILRLLIRNIMP